MRVVTQRERGDGGALDRQVDGLRRELPLLVVVLVLAGGLVLTAVGHWRIGAGVLGAAVLLGAALRLVLPARRAGLLVVRTRRLDVAALLALGLGLLLLGSSVPTP